VGDLRSMRQPLVQAILCTAVFWQDHSKLQHTAHEAEFKQRHMEKI
jgi:hypothetical protein